MIVIATVSGITLWWSAIVSAIRISYALRDIPRHHKEHWLFGNLPFVVSHSFVHIPFTFDLSCMATHYTYWASQFADEL